MLDSWPRRVICSPNLAPSIFVYQPFAIVVIIIVILMLFKCDALLSHRNIPFWLPLWVRVFVLLFRVRVRRIYEADPFVCGAGYLLICDLFCARLQFNVYAQVHNEFSDICLIQYEQSSGRLCLPASNRHSIIGQNVYVSQLFDNVCVLPHKKQRPTSMQTWYWKIAIRKSDDQSSIVTMR